MQASVKLGFFLAASALAGLAQAQTGAAQTETVGGAQSGSFVGTPLTPQAAHPTKGDPVTTYRLQDAWPTKAESAPRPIVQQPPPAPRTTTPGWPAKIERGGLDASKTR